MTIRSNPAIVFTNARVVFTAELEGGADDFADYYCAKVEWDWMDGTKSEAGDDCDPYSAGKSQIRRRFAQEHRFLDEGNYDVAFRLKQGNKIVGSQRVTIRVRFE